MANWLEFVAREMRAAAMRIEPGSERGITRELKRGLRLRLTLLRDPLEGTMQMWVLAMSRPSVAPGDQEIAIVRHAFGVPADAEFTWATPFEVQVRWAG